MEINVGILDGRVLGAIEIAPKSGIYDYEAKYTPGMTEYFMPARLAARATAASATSRSARRGRSAARARAASTCS